MHKRSSVSFAEARSIDPVKTEKVAGQQGAWSVAVTEPNGHSYTLPPGSDVRLDGFAGTARLVVALGPDGQPGFDKLLYAQKPGVVIVAWGRDPEGLVRMAYLVQARPFAHDDRDPGPLDFGQIPMGFLTRADRETPLPIAIQNAVGRELNEEAGVTRVIGVEIPDPCVYWQDPTFVENGTLVAFAEVELASVGAPTGDHADGERIKKVEFLPVAEVLNRIRQGRTPDGTNHHMGLSLGPLMMFFARHPEHFSTVR